MEFNIQTIITLVGTIVGSGFLGAWISGAYKARSEDKKTEVDATAKLIDHWEKLLEPLRQRVAFLEKELEEARERENAYKERISTLENQLILFESSHVDIPLPIWMKDTSMKMVFLNGIYEDVFLIPRGKNIKDYLGKDDYSVWDKDIADAFRAHDEEVMRKKKHVRFVEEIRDAKGDTVYLDILKYPRKVGNKVIGISGIVMNMTKEKENL